MNEPRPFLIHETKKKRLIFIYKIKFDLGNCVTCFKDYYTHVKNA